MEKENIKKEDIKDEDNTNEDSYLELNNTPNKITGIRIAIIPLIIGAMFVRTEFWDWVAAMIFILASLTDALDGYLARTSQSVTVFGKLLDPLADKFLVLSALVILQHVGTLHPLIVIVLISREFAITGLRSIATTEGVVIAASNLAKAKTVTQMVAIPMLIVNRKYGFLDFKLLGHLLIYVSVIISVVSAKDYIVDFFRGLKENRAKKKKLKQLRRDRKRKMRAKKKAKIRRLLQKFKENSDSSDS